MAEDPRKYIDYRIDKDKKFKNPTKDPDKDTFGEVVRDNSYSYKKILELYAETRGLTVDGSFYEWYLRDAGNVVVGYWSTSLFVYNHIRIFNATESDHACIIELLEKHMVITRDDILVYRNPRS
ncbi:hypothetical protein [Pseudomonas sp. CCC3.1]|uniref:hypothetical protein n=1 Tax=Pseudomonas sp. CCC3.1 TaxID=3048607 RepID=UPI002AC9EA8A|nr:hypothetical protein [Pseudomonas sp. CCC3.1]MEB0208249.1 hypothetical protein [Pseudomonas sp. CCC3.1]WPX37127.1 hypothetical protein RHM56_02735 [Pseudomonas sp. CCC3.1]